jgi:hypothetical protein
LPVLDFIPHIKVSLPDGSATDEYRLRSGRVEVRALDDRGRTYPGYSEWIVLSPEEIKLHFVRQTPVARWLKELLAPGAENSFNKPKEG